MFSNMLDKLRHFWMTINTRPFEMDHREILKRTHPHCNWVDTRLTTTGDMQSIFVTYGSDRQIQSFVLVTTPCDTDEVHVETFGTVTRQYLERSTRELQKRLDVMDKEI